MLFDELMMQMQKTAEGSWSVNITDDWLQGRSAFGGLQVSLAVKAMRALVADQPLRVLQTTFLAPVPPGGVEVQARILRAGKNATHVEAKLTSGGQLACLIVGIFGTTRESTVNVRPQQPVVVSERPRTLPMVPGVTPVFLQHFDMRWLRGNLPFTGGSSAEAVIEVGFRPVPGVESGTTSELHLVSLADTIPPLAITLLRKPAPASSMTWMLELLADRYDHQPLQNWRFDAQVTSAGNGYTSQTAMIWAPDGSPAMLSRQNMVVFG